MSSLALVAVGTWFPVAGALAGAAVAAGTLQKGAFIGGVAGLLVSGLIFGALYFRGAKLIVT